MIWVPLWRIQKSVRLIIADDLLQLSIEDQLASQEIGEVAQDAEY